MSLKPDKKAHNGVIKVDTEQKLKFSIKYFFSRYDQIRNFCDLVTFTEEILNGKLHFLYSVKI